MTNSSRAAAASRPAPGAELPFAGIASLQRHLDRLREWAARTGALEPGALSPPPWPEAGANGPTLRRHDQ